MAVHAPAPTRLQSRVLGRQRRLHPLSRRLLRILQPAPSLGTVDHGQHNGPAHGLQADDQGQRQHLFPLHRLPGLYIRTRPPIFCRKSWLKQFTLHRIWKLTNVHLRFTSTNFLNSKFP